MIPTLKREHVEKALRHIDAEGVPRRRTSKKYLLVANGRKYPPKYVLSLTIYYAYGRELQPDEFGGGEETNGCLRSFGYTIQDKTTSRKKKSYKHKNKYRHTERCPECKATVFEMLKQVYGSAEKNHHFNEGTKPEFYTDSPWHQELEAIFQALSSYRGFKNFVKTQNLPNCDFYVPDPGFIVEFDESQHFTECRRLALSMYPQSLQTGFDLKKWMELCIDLNAQDNNPPYRDEQRAWYDTLRDLLP